MLANLVTADLYSFNGFLAQVVPANDSGTGWVIAGVGAVGLMYLYMRGRAKKRADPLADPARMNTAQQKHLDRQMQSLVVELSEMAREMSAQIDTRSQKLTALMEDADKKIAELQRLKSELASGFLMDAHRGQAASAAQGRGLPQATPQQEAAPRMSVVSDDTGRGGPGTAAGREQAQRLPQMHLQHDVLLQHAEVYQLADLGESVVEISRRLGKPSGEIELILSLRKSPRRVAL